MWRLFYLARLNEPLFDLLYLGWLSGMALLGGAARARARSAKRKMGKLQGFRTIAPEAEGEPRSPADPKQLYVAKTRGTVEVPLQGSFVPHTGPLSQHGVAFRLEQGVEFGHAITGERVTWKAGELLSPRGIIVTGRLLDTAAD